MEKFAEEFIQNFHALEGITVANRQKNLFKLLHQNASFLKENPAILNSISTNLAPRTYLESLFKVDFLIYFRRSSELQELLKEGNDVFVSKITKQVWFFKETFKEIEANELVNETLPCMSFSVRMKVLRKLNRYLSSEQFDKIFDAVVARYGIFLASQFITGCSSTKIRLILPEYPIKLTSTQLRIFYEKDPSLIDFYFSQRRNLIHESAYKSLFKLIFTQDQDLYNVLKEKYKISLRFGQRTTKKIVAVKKDEIIEKPHDFRLFLHMKAVIRKIGKDSVKLFCNTLPVNLQKPYEKNWVSTLFPKKDHYNLYVKIFQTHYNIKFANYPSLITEDILNLIPENSERALLAKVKVDQGFDNYLKYLTTEDSIPLIKEKINLTSDISERGHLIEYLIESCHINNDIDALFSVMKYFCFRHKNDELSVHLQFINNIERLFGFKKFTEEMWNCLNELLLIHTLKFKQDDATQQKIQKLPLLSFNIGISCDQKLSYLEFLFNKGEPIDELILDYVTSENRFPQSSQYDKKFVKYFILTAIKQRQVSLKEKDIFLNLKLIDQTERWNSCNKNDPMCFYDFPVLVHTFNYAIRKYYSKISYEYNNVLRVFTNTIFTTNENSYRPEYMKVYWENVDFFGNLSRFKWFLKYDPFAITNNFDITIKQLTADDSKVRLNLWHTIKKYSHLQLDQKYVERSLSELSDDNSEKKQKFVPCLSVLMKPEDYAVLADSFKPVNNKLDVKNESEVRRYNVQCAIANQFRNTKSYTVLSSLLNYCVGDYFKDSMRSLYSILYRTPENTLPQYLNYLSKKAVSVRKHALFLTCELSTLTKIEHMITMLNKQEGVQSLQKHIFSTTIKYFVKNPSDPFFNLVKLNMMFINKTDTESLNSITEHFAKIPKSYKAQYVQYSWEFLEKTIDIWEKISQWKQTLLRGIIFEINVVKQIPLEFGMKIIEQHFMTCDGPRDLHGINDFIFIFVRYREEKTQIFEKTFDKLDQCESQDKVFSFLRNWHQYVMATKDNNLKNMEPLANYYEKKVSVIHYFHDFIKIFFLREKLKSYEDHTVDAFSARVVTFFENLVSDHGLYVIPLFGHEMKSQISFFRTEQITEYDFYYSMIANRAVPTVAFLLLGVILKPSHLLPLSLITFNKILEKIENIDDSGVQINLQCKFKAYLESEKYRIGGAEAMEIGSSFSK